MAAKSSSGRRPPAEPLMPCAPEAERVLIGMLASGEYGPVIEDCRDIGLKPDHFYMLSEGYDAVWAAAAAINARDQLVNYVSLDAELRRRGSLGDGRIIENIAQLTACANDIPPGLTPQQCAHEIVDAALRRRLIDAGAQVAVLAQSGQGTVANAVEYAEGMVADVRDEYAGVLGGSVDAGDVFPLLTIDELEEMPPVRGLLGDVLYEKTLAILYGASQRWKSFIALAWALCIAAGMPWMGKPTVQGDVVYVAAEGGAGIGPRVRAWRIKHEVSRDAVRKHFHPLVVPVHLLDPVQVEKLIRTVRQACETPALVVFDTLSRSMAGGDENAGKDGSRALAAADSVREALGCTVLFVAHPGKDSTLGIRGWSGYFQWADTVICAKGGEDKPRMEPGEPVTLICDKPKDSEPFEPLVITTEVVRVVDEQGNSLKSSLVVIPGAEAMAEQQAKIARRLTSQQQKTLDSLGAVSGGRAKYGEWKRSAEVYGVPKRTFDDCRDALMRLEYVIVDSQRGEYVSLVRNPIRTSAPAPLRTSAAGAGVSIDTRTSALDRRRSAAPEEG